MDFYRTKSKMHLSSWEDKKLIVLEVTPAMEGNSKGQPQAGEIRYNKDAKCSISFTIEKAFQAAFHIMKMNEGVDFKYEQMADTTKVAGVTGGEIKSLTIDKSKNGGIAIFMKSGDRTANIILSHAEAYAVQKYLETYAARFL